MIYDEKAHNYNILNVSNGLHINKLFELLEVDNYENAWKEVLRLQYKIDDCETLIYILQTKLSNYINQFGD